MQHPPNFTTKSQTPKFIIINSPKTLKIRFLHSPLSPSKSKLTITKTTKKTKAKHLRLETGSYPFPHTAKLAGLKFIPRRALEAEHEKLSFKVDYFFIQLLGWLRPDFLQLFLFLRHHHHRRRRRRGSPVQRACGAARGAHVREANAMKWRRGGGFCEVWFGRENHARNWKARHHFPLLLLLPYSDWR